MPELVSGAAVDGRTARRQRNINAVLDVVHEMFAEDMVIPTIEQTSKRAGVSLRSMYRYFADSDELIAATIERVRERNANLAYIPHLGDGPLDDRIADLVSVRVRVYDQVAPTWRAAIVNAPKIDGVARSLADARQRLRAQFLHQFASELELIDPARRSEIESGGDAMTQFDTIDYLHRHRDLDLLAVERVLRAGLRALLLPAGNT